MNEERILEIADDAVGAFEAGEAIARLIGTGLRLFLDKVNPLRK